MLQRRPPQDHHLQGGAYWWSPSEGAYPLSDGLESIKEQGG
nr:DUF6330 family protein [Puniceibacterium sp. IMCC21224]